VVLILMCYVAILRHIQNLNDVPKIV
jgi:hypothetical protein